MAPEPQSTCEACSKPTTSKCGGCASDTYTHAYCSPECQKKDWSKNKLVCKDLELERKLERVAAIVHKAYLNFREDTWDTPINRIVVKAGEIIKFDGDQTEDTRFFLKFPSQMIKNENMRSAVLTSWMCNEPLVFMFNLLKKLLGGRQCMSYCSRRWN